MRFLKQIIFFIFTATCVAGAFAQVGSNAYTFLDIPISSRIYGLGGVNISLVDNDVSTIDQNPALLGGEMSGQIALGYMRYVGDSNFAGLRYAHAAGEHAAWSAAIQYFGYGDMIEADESGTQLGNFSPKDAVFMGAYSHDITDRLRGGINIKAAYSTYAEYSAFALATDLGINYFDPDEDLSLSAVVANLGGQVKKFNEKYDRLPIDIRLGISKVFAGFPIRLSVTAWNLTKWNLPYYEYGDGSVETELKKKDSFTSNLFRHLVFGADVVSSPNWYLGIGYNYKQRTDMQTHQRNMLSGFSISGGIMVSDFAIGVAFAQRYTGATTFMFNLSANLSGIL